MSDQLDLSEEIPMYIIVLIRNFLGVSFSGHLICFVVIADWSVCFPCDGACRGGNQTHWPFGGGLIRYRQADAVFLPAVLPPTPGASKTEPTRLSSCKVRVFSLKGGDLHWTLPRSWIGKSIESATITPMGVRRGPMVAITDDTLSLSDVPAASPVILSVPSAHSVC